ncbi:unnamed protein product [Macrosiphum euphorbiae]|uniref:Uncharacterized protein n=1 Tax=Macrosiphum euphorbiae TaxID=13131 RepID=A0AAV0XF86_9HEMI|nr:unnamed protein product [Macrosiphum euphorbiae]
MLNLKVMMFACLSVTAVFCENDQKRYNSNTESCLLETNMSRDEFQAMLATENDSQLVILKTQAHKCMFGCMMRKNHIINNGIVSVDVLNAYVLNFYGTSDYKRRLISKKVEQVVDICTKKDNLPTEECALAGILIPCIAVEANKAGLADEYPEQP